VVTDLIFSLEVRVIVVTGLVNTRLSSSLQKIGCIVMKFSQSDLQLIAQTSCALIIANVIHLKAAHIGLMVTILFRMSLMNNSIYSGMKED
jgi:hypothetical protein